MLAASRFNESPTADYSKENASSSSLSLALPTLHPPIRWKHILDLVLHFLIQIRKAFQLRSFAPISYTFQPESDLVQCRCHGPQRIERGPNHFRRIWNLGIGEIVFLELLFFNIGFEVDHFGLSFLAAG